MVEAVTESVTTVIRWVVPVMLIVFALGTLVREKPLRTTSALGGTTRGPGPAATGPATAEPAHG